MKHWWIRGALERGDRERRIPIAAGKGRKERNDENKMAKDTCIQSVRREKLVGKKEHNMEEKLKKEWTKKYKKD